ncbi:MAG: FAD-binding oxidoreductase [Gemmatimonadales bacterium]
MEQHLRSLLGDSAVVERTHHGEVRVAPHTEEVLSALLAAATEAKWKVQIEGHGSWMPTDSPAEVVVSTSALNTPPVFSAADLVVTASAGMHWSELQRQLHVRGAWVALDPPGGERTVGSIVSTATAGTLRGSYGGVRDHVLGVTLVSADGRLLKFGGVVVKNVAGFDLAKLVTGSFGAFGIVTSVTFRLRALPRADTTHLGKGSRDELFNAALDVLRTGTTPAALELLSPDVLGDAQWGLAVRLTGSAAEVEAARGALHGAVSIPLPELGRDEALALWRTVSSHVTERQTTVRLGALPSATDRMLDLTAHHLSADCTTVAVGVGSVRWSGTTALEDLRLLRHVAAQQEVPLTIERAPWQLRYSLGHFGAYREGIARLVRGLRETFDPAAILLAPLDGPS